MVRLFGVVTAWAAVVAASHAHAGPSRADVIPPGEGWFCFELKDVYFAGVGVCTRDESRCIDLRSERAATAVVEPGECRAQAKASVLTYFDVMQDRWGGLALSSTKACTRMRASMLKDPDNKSISTCQLMGKKSPPPAKVANHVVPTGDSWFCARSGSCVRDEQSCRGALSDDDFCKKQPRAFLFTARELSDDPGFGSFVFSTQKACEAERQAHLFEWFDVSNCKSFGAVTPADERSTGWFCYDGTKESGHCARAKDECDARRSYDMRRDYAPGECRAQSPAFAFRNGEDLEGYPTERECRAAVVDANNKAQCTSVK